MTSIARIGKGGNDRYFYGVRIMMAVHQQGVARGWVLASGKVQERWVAELLFSTWAGMPGVQGPLDAQRHTPKATLPTEWMAAVPSGGAASDKPILSESGFHRDDWLEHWAQAYDVRVCPLPTAASRAQRRWWRAPAGWSKRPLPT